MTINYTPKHKRPLINIPLPNRNITWYAIRAWIITLCFLGFFVGVIYLYISNTIITSGLGRWITGLSALLWILDMNYGRVFLDPEEIEIDGSSDEGLYVGYIIFTFFITGVASIIMHSSSVHKYAYEEIVCNLSMTHQYTGILVDYKNECGDRCRNYEPEKWIIKGDDGLKEFAYNHCKLTDPDKEFYRKK